MRSNFTPSLLTLCAATALTLPARAQISMVDTINGSFIDISTTGTNLLLHENEEDVVFTTISNQYFPAGPVCVSNNGGIAFNPTIEDLAAENTSLPSQRAFGNSLALLAFWDDIGNKLGGVYYQDMGDRYIIQWHNRSWDDGSPERVRFQIQVFPDQPGYRGGQCVLAQFIYDQIDGPRADGGAGATIGVQGGIGTGVNDFTWSFNTANSVDQHTRPVLTVVCMPAPASSMLLVGLLAFGRRRSNEWIKAGSPGRGL